MLSLLLIGIIVGALANKNATNSTNTTKPQYLLTSAEKCLTLDGYKFCSYSDDIAQSIVKTNRTIFPVKYGFCCYQNDTANYTEP
jgi:hypothetical protein